MTSRDARTARVYRLAGWRCTVFRLRFVVLSLFVFTSISAAADPLSDLRAVLQRYPAKARFAVTATVRVSGQSEDAGSRAGSAKFMVEVDSGALLLRVPPATLSAAAAEIEKKKHDSESPTPTRNAMVAVTAFDIIDALDLAAMFRNDLQGASLISRAESSLAGKPATLLRIDVKPDLAGTRSRLVDEPVIELRIWLNADGVPIAAERDSKYSASFLFVKAANVRKEHWDIAVAGDRLYATSASQSNRASAAGKALASSRSVTYETK